MHAKLFEFKYKKKSQLVTEIIFFYKKSNIMNKKFRSLFNTEFLIKILDFLMSIVNDIF